MKIVDKIKKIFGIVDKPLTDAELAKGEIEKDTVERIQDGVTYIDKTVKVSNLQEQANRYRKEHGRYTSSGESRNKEDDEDFDGY